MAARKARRQAAKTKTKAKTKVRARTETRSKVIAPLANRLYPPKDGMVVRMYRIGHGDCFLLAFPGKTDDKPVYMLIDCGYKPGSPSHINTTAKEITANIRDVTGGHIDIAVITHEHQDHVNGMTAENFKGVTVGETWFAWTEDGDDKLAKKLRRRFKDRLVGLAAARNRLAAEGGKVERIDDFLAFELGGEEEEFSAARSLAAAASGAENSQNKRAMKLFKTLANNNCRYLSPHGKAAKVEGVDGLRIYPLGPPHDEELLHSLDPEGDEGFRSFGFGPAGNYFATAVVGAGKKGNGAAPFAPRYQAKWNDALKPKARSPFWLKFYGKGKKGMRRLPIEVEASPSWRRIDLDWLYSAERLALDMNNDTNNGSLVLAFELKPGGKVLLFAADAQRGNWVSWTKGTWKDGARTVDTRDLLGRTVLYKVGHHGSHNATLRATKDKYASLDWMAQGEYEQEFTAMITAVRPWAETKKGWDHPLKAIKDALLIKARGRVFQTDTDVKSMTPAGSKAEWNAFLSRVKDDRLFIDYTVKY